MITYDRSDGTVYVGTVDTSSFHPHPPGQTARLSVVVSTSRVPIVEAETVVDEWLRGSFRIRYCDLLPYRDDEMWLFVTIERADGKEWGRGVARPRFNCATVEPPAACASLCAAE